MRRLLVLTIFGALLLAIAVPAMAQEVTGGCNATVNGQTLDTLDAKHPLIIEKGDTVALTGSVPATASGGSESLTKIYVEVVGDIQLAEEPGTGEFWGGTVEIPELLTSLAPGVYKVKGTAEGSGWLCTGSAYVKIEGGPWTAATAIGAVAAVAGGIGAAAAIKPKKGQIFHEGPSGGGAPETPTKLVADAAVLLILLLLIYVIGNLDPSWVV